MRTGTRIGLVLSVVILVVLVGYGFLLFDGDLDSDGQYEVLQAVSYSPNKIAFEVERTDNQALSGPRYAVLIGDHVPSTIEMKRAMISFWRHRSFALADQNIRIQWTGPNSLTLMTAAPDTSPDWVLNQKHQICNVVIRYLGQP